MIDDIDDDVVAVVYCCSVVFQGAGMTNRKGDMCHKKT